MQFNAMVNDPIDIHTLYTIRYEVELIEDSQGLYTLPELKSRLPVKT